MDTPLSDSEHVHYYLTRLAEIVRLWQSYYPTNHTPLDAEMIAVLKKQFLQTKQVHLPWPSVLDPTYATVLDLIARTEVTQRGQANGDDITAFWNETVQRADAAADHIARMQQSSGE